jgi:hypothetical protein
MGDEGSSDVSGGVSSDPESGDDPALSSPENSITADDDAVAQAEQDIANQNSLSAQMNSMSQEVTSISVNSALSIATAALALAAGNIPGAIGAIGNAFGISTSQADPSESDALDALGLGQSSGAATTSGPQGGPGDSTAAAGQPQPIQEPMAPPPAVTDEIDEVINNETLSPDEKRDLIEVILRRGRWSTILTSERGLRSKAPTNVISILGF